MNRVVYKLKKSSQLVCTSGRNDPIYLSKYNKKTTKQIIHKMIKNGYKDWFLIGPIYENENGTRDMQVCVTGKIKIHENIYQGIHRETFEELGISMDLSQLQSLYSTYERRKTCNHYVSVLGIYDDYLHSQHIRHYENTNTQHDDDDHFNKISTFYLIPTLSTALSFLQQTNSLSQENDIVGLGIVKVSDVL